MSRISRDLGTLRHMLRWLLFLIIFVTVTCNGVTNTLRDPPAPWYSPTHTELGPIVTVRGRVMRYSGKQHDTEDPHLWLTYPDDHERLVSVTPSFYYSAKEGHNYRLADHDVFNGFAGFVTVIAWAILLIAAVALAVGIMMWLFGAFDI